MRILQLISSDAFITLNKEMIKAVGLEEAIMIGELASEFDYWQKRQGLTEDGYFFSTVENVEDKTTLSDFKQRRCLKNLQEAGLISVSIRGIPAKRYVKLNEENIANIFKNKESKNLRASSKETKELVPEKLESNKNIANNNINNNNILCNVETSSTTNNFSAEIKEIVDYLNVKTQSRYRANTPNTQKHIVARLKQDYTVDDFKHVIDVKCAEWLGTDMQQYLRPDTLFGTKFDYYLQQKMPVKKPSNNLTFGNNKNPAQLNAQGHKPMQTIEVVNELPF